MRYKHSYHVSPKDELEINGKKIYPGDDCFLGVTLFKKYYLGTEDEHDCRRIIFTRITKKELSNFDILNRIH